MATTFGAVLITAAVTLTSVLLTRRAHAQEGKAARSGDLDRDLRATRITFYADFLDKSRRLFSILSITEPAGLEDGARDEIELGEALGSKVFDAVNDFNRALNAVVLLGDAPVRRAAKRVEYLLFVCLRQRAEESTQSVLSSITNVEDELIQAMSAEIKVDAEIVKDVPR